MISFIFKNKSRCANFANVKADCHKIPKKKKLAICLTFGVRPRQIFTLNEMKTMNISQLLDGTIRRKKQNRDAFKRDVLKTTGSLNFMSRPWREID